MGLLLIIALQFFACFHYLLVNNLTKTLLVLTAGFLLGCQTTEPVVDYSSENVISFRYHGYNIGPTLPVEVRDLAAKH